VPLEANCSIPLLVYHAVFAHLLVELPWTTADAPFFIAKVHSAFSHAKED